MRHRRAIPLGSLLVLAALLGCATPVAPTDPVEDPWQPANQPVFGFNEGVDKWVLRPVSKGWSFLTFEELRRALGRAFDNLEFPRRLVASLGQAKLVGAGTETGRFIVNTTIGLVGLFDPASRLGLEPYDEDVGQMFGRWGIASGPYWVLPLIGPSSPRDFMGFLFDTVLSPLSYASFVGAPGVGVVAQVNARALADRDIEMAREAALDYYVLVRDAYVQRRRYQVLDEEIPEEEKDDASPSEDLYEFDEGPDGESEDEGM